MIKQVIATTIRVLDRIAAILRYKHLFLIGVVVFLFFFKTFWAPDLLFLIFLVIFLVYGAGKEFIRKFAPFVILLLSYESLRGLAPMITGRVHYTEMIDFDRWLTGGGEIPTVILQQWWYNGTLHWYDYYFYFAYMIHFLLPFLLAILIWKLRPKFYWQFIGAFLVLSYAGFITYVLYPAAPPWMSSEMGLLPPITKLGSQIWWDWGVHNIPTLYSKLNPNPVAAVPSLHCAYPTLALLFMHRLFGPKISLPFLIYPASVWLGVVYLGEHYVIDVILGIIYAIGAFYAVDYASRRGWHKPIVYHAKRHARRLRPGWMRPKPTPATSVASAAPNEPILKP